MNHHPVAEGHQVFEIIAAECESHLFWLKYFGHSSSQLQLTLMHSSFIKLSLASFWKRKKINHQPQFIIIRSSNPLSITAVINCKQSCEMPPNNFTLEKELVYLNEQKAKRPCQRERKYIQDIRYQPSPLPDTIAV